MTDPVAASVMQYVGEQMNDLRAEMCQGFDRLERIARDDRACFLPRTEFHEYRNSALRRMDSHADDIKNLYRWLLGVAGATVISLIGGIITLLIALSGK
jgi:hypothetical protein